MLVNSSHLFASAVEVGNFLFTGICPGNIGLLLITDGVDEVGSGVVRLTICDVILGV